MNSLKKSQPNLQPPLYLILTCFFIVACNTKSEDKKNPTTPANEYLSSYEVVEGCSTGRQVFKANSEAEIENVVCSALADENLNKQCATGMRAELFRNISCRGIFPVKISPSITSTSTSTFSKSYAYQEDSCSTGLHFFYASSQSKALDLLCKALQDDQFNRNCAKTKREDAIRKNECVKVTASTSKPEEKSEAAPVPKEDNDSDAPFSCYHENNICDEKSQYCLISKTSTGLRNTDECLKFPTECKDDDCLIESAKLTFCKNGDPNHCTDNCKGGAQLSRKNNRVTVICISPPLQKHF